MTLQETICNLCGSQESITLYAGSIADVECSASRYYSSSRKYAYHFPIVQCASCKLVRSGWMDDEATLRSIYSQIEDPDYEVEVDNRMRTGKSYLGWISRFCNEPRCLLDIGCSTGIFLYLANQKGWKVFGLEPSNWAASIASHRVLSDEISIGTLEEADFPAEYFDAITLWDVLEHLASPSDALNRINRWLKPSGWLFLNTPNISSFPARMMGSHWVLFLREHIWYFSTMTIETMLNKCGFKTVSRCPNLVWFSAGSIIKRISQYNAPLRTGNHRSYAKFSGFHGLPIRFPIGEMRVAAQKI